MFTDIYVGKKSRKKIRTLSTESGGDKHHNKHAVLLILKINFTEKETDPENRQWKAEMDRDGGCGQVQKGAGPMAQSTCTQGRQGLPELESHLESKVDRKVGTEERRGEEWGSSKVTQTLSLMPKCEVTQTEHHPSEGPQGGLET